MMGRTLLARNQVLTLDLVTEGERGGGREGEGEGGEREGEERREGEGEGGEREGEGGWERGRGGGRDGRERGRKGGREGGRDSNPIQERRLYLSPFSPILRIRVLTSSAPFITTYRIRYGVHHLTPSALEKLGTHSTTLAGIQCFEL